MKNKRGAGHVDWTISIGIFLIFLLSILVFIKPAYKPAYESEVLGEILKDSFLEKNSKTIYRTLVKNQHRGGCNGYLEANIGDLGSNEYVTDSNFQSSSNYFKKDTSTLLFNNIDANYWVYHNLESGGTTGTLDFRSANKCENSKVGETTEYTGLKSSTISSFETPKFPETKEFNVKTRNANTGEQLDKKGNEPPEDVNVYVYEFVYPIISFNKSPLEGQDFVKKENIIVSIQIW